MAPGWPIVATVLVLWIAFASLFAVVLGYSRVLMQQRQTVIFFRLLPNCILPKDFPTLSLLFLGAAGFVFSLLFKLADVISAILAMRILVQFIAQSVGVVLLRKNRPAKQPYFKMWLYPLPVILSVWIWLFVFYSTGKYALLGLGLTLAGVLVYYLTRHLWGNPDLTEPRRHEGAE